MFANEPWARGIHQILGLFIPEWTGAHPWDYGLHFGVSFAGVVFLYTLFFSALRLPATRSFAAACIILVGLGIFKELIDPEISVLDLLFDALGIIAAARFCNQPRAS